ncbi:MAG: hydrogenase maturation nickel metallochaperone HypA [bacterium]
MHELSVAQEIINIAQQYLPENNSEVKSVKLKIGKLSSILVDSLLFCFDAVSKGTPLHEAKLLIEEEPITINCGECMSESILHEIEFVCPVCGSTSIEVISGTEMHIMEIELNEKPELQ